MTCTRAELLAGASSAALLALAPSSPAFADQSFTEFLAEQARKDSKAKQEEVKAKRAAIAAEAKAINERRQASGREADARRLAEKERIRAMNKPKTPPVALSRDEFIAQSRKSTEAKRGELQAKQAAIEENAKAINERRQAEGKEAAAKRVSATSA